MSLDRVNPISRAGGISEIKPYDSRGRRDREEKNFKEIQKDALEKKDKDEAEEEKSNFNPRAYTSFFPTINLRQSLNVQEYDYLSKDNIQTVCYNLVIYLWMNDKRFQDLEDRFVLEIKSDFFGDYGEKLLDKQLEKIEKITGEFTGIDEIIDVKKAIYSKLYDYLIFADDNFQSLMKKYPKEFMDLRDKLYRNPQYARDYKSVSMKETFFVTRLKELYKEIHPEE